MPDLVRTFCTSFARHARSKPSCFTFALLVLSQALACIYLDARLHGALSLLHCHAALNTQSLKFVPPLCQNNACAFHGRTYQRWPPRSSRLTELYVFLIQLLHSAPTPNRRPSILKPDADPKQSKIALRTLRRGVARLQGASYAPGLVGRDAAPAQPNAEKTDAQASR